jgi:TolA-binding protein
LFVVPLIAQFILTSFVPNAVSMSAIAQSQHIKTNRGLSKASPTMVSVQKMSLVLVICAMAHHISVVECTDSSLPQSDHDLLSRDSRVDKKNVAEQHGPAVGHPSPRNDFQVSELIGKATPMARGTCDREKDQVKNLYEKVANLNGKVTNLNEQNTNLNEQNTNLKAQFDAIKKENEELKRPLGHHSLTSPISADTSKNIKPPVTMVNITAYNLENEKAQNIVESDGDSKKKSRRTLRQFPRQLLNRRMLTDCDGKPETHACTATSGCLWDTVMLTCVKEEEEDGTAPGAARCDSYTCTAGTNKGSYTSCTGNTATCDDATCCDAGGGAGSDSGSGSGSGCTWKFVEDDASLSGGWNVLSANCTLGSDFTVPLGKTLKIKKDPSIVGVLVIDRQADEENPGRHFYVSGTLNVEGVTLTGGFVSAR